MLNKTIIAIVAAVLGLSASAQADSPADIVRQVIDNSPRLQSLRLSHQAETEALSRAGHFDRQPEAEFEHLWGPHGNRWGAGVSQSFALPSVYRDRSRAAKAQITAFQYLYDSEVQELRREAQQLIAQGVYARRKRDLLNTLLDNIRQVDSLVKDGYSHGQLTVLDVKKLDYQYYSYETRRQEVIRELQTADGAIDALSGDRGVNCDFSDYPMMPLLSLDDYLDYATGNNPQVKALAQNAEASRYAAQSARSERLPEFSLGYRHAFEDNTHFNGLTVGLTLPVFTTSAQTKAATLQALSLDTQSLGAAAQAQAQARALYNSASDAMKHLQGIQRVSLDNEYPDLLLMAYRGGQINVITYLQELNYYLEARMDCLAAEYAAVQTLIDLNRFNPDASAVVK